MKRSFISFSEMVEFYKSTLQRVLFYELEICHDIIHSKEFSDWERAEILLMGGHQWRLNTHAQERDITIGRLEKAALWKRSYNDFEEIYQAVIDTIADVKYVGPLAWYDTAKRIAYCCGLEPKQWVYLCCGAKKGAKALLGDKNVKGSIIEEKVFQKYFLDLSAIHIENILCIMKDFFENGKIKKSMEGFFNDCGCLRWTCSKELREKYKKLFPSKY